jgi:hypothetical protein
MADADDALRGEIEKVRERARLQALAQGLPPDESDRRGQKAVNDFCAKWGIRPDMVGPPRSARPASPAPPVRAVDLGSSPLRSAANPSATQAIRIADLIKRGMVQPPAPPARPASMSPPPPAERVGLAGLLDRVRAQSQPDAGAAPPPRAPAPAPSPPPRAGAPAAGVPPLGTTPPVSEAEARRRALLDQFDRVYAEVQAMLEQRIGVADLALNEVPLGLASAFDRAAAAGLGSEEAKVLTLDVQRLRDALRQMTAICDEFLSHLDEFVDRASTRGGS